MNLKELSYQLSRSNSLNKSNLDRIKSCFIKLGLIDIEPVKNANIDGSPVNAIEPPLMVVLEAEAKRAAFQSDDLNIVVEKLEWFCGLLQEKESDHEFCPSNHLKNEVYPSGSLQDQKSRMTDRGMH